jgi:hypothetical protein
MSAAKHSSNTYINSLIINKKEIPWVSLVWNYYPNGVPQATNLCGSFWWRDTMKLVDKYRTFCTATSEKVTLSYFGMILGKELSLLRNSPIAISCSRYFTVC